MNNRFSFKRLLLLIQKQFSENVKLYLYGTLALLGLLAIVMFLWVLFGGNSYSGNTLFEFYLMGLFILGAIFASFSFSMLSSKDKGIYWLTLPASHGEKLACALFYNVLVFTVVYTLCYLLVAKGAAEYVSELVCKHPEKYHFYHINWSKPKGSSWEELRCVLYAFFAVQALYLLGSVYFKKYSFVFTTAVGALLIIAFIFFIKSLSASFNKYGATFDIVNAHGTANGVWQKEYFFNHTVSGIIIFLAKFIWAPFFWLVTWFRLREKEI
ncbi:hypothetical protein A9P82_07540 [Arachidicoccus ginsenosidimutans]|uniref:hypothetical protein n=1 Tax=Arachidicoccus sp. BS20 TaxID=1850526 RepID=UPI0007F17242|nr:hypothetical protein [Arachidicoccus sp. BS20]ANI89155.1 hypothetical protein A9P82_07540 [Arachidicoccus sp. BS20]